MVNYIDCAEDDCPLNSNDICRADNYGALVVIDGSHCLSYENIIKNEWIDSLKNGDKA